MAENKALSTILRLPVENGTKGPSTPEGKFLAMALCFYPKATNDLLPSRSSLFSRVQISPYLGGRAYQNLEYCQWIQGGRFYPRINERLSGTKHIHAIRALLNGYQEQAQDWLTQHPKKGLTVKNRLLLAILLDREELGGRLKPTSLGDLVKLTGFSSDQIKGQLQKLKEIGLVSGVIPGVTGASVFGIAKSYIYLNFLHPFWSCFFPDWRAICLDASTWQDFSTSEDSAFHKLIGRDGNAELDRRSELKKYFRNFLVLFISRIFSRYWNELKMNVHVSIHQEEHIVTRFLKTELPASDLFWFMVVLGNLASQLQSKLCSYDRALIETVEDVSWKFCVLPNFNDQPQSLVVLTNCESVSRGVDSTWLRSNDHARWIEKGFATNPDAAPLKLRSRKPKPF